MKKSYKYNRVTVKQIIRKSMKNELTLISEQNTLTKFGKTLIETYCGKNDNYYYVIFVVRENGNYDFLTAFQSKLNFFYPCYLDYLFYILRFHLIDFNDVYYFCYYRGEVICRTYK